MDDWSISAETRAAANGQAPKPTKPVTLTQARFFMDDSHRRFTPPTPEEERANAERNE